LTLLPLALIMMYLFSTGDDCLGSAVRLNIVTGPLNTTIVVVPQFNVSIAKKEEHKN
jgi:hypothetical protein